MSTSEELSSFFKDLTKKPEVLLENEDHSTKYEKFLKVTYDYIKKQELQSYQSNALPELITEHFDAEQIWQQIELQNDSYLTHSIQWVSKFVVGKHKLIFNEVQDIKLNEQAEDELNEKTPVMQSEESSDDEDDTEPLNLQEDSDEVTLDLSDSEGQAAYQAQKKYKTSNVDDKFFKLGEMEAFLQAEEKKLVDAEPDSGNDSEDDEEEVDDYVDLFNDLEKNDTERGGINNPKYKDFFGGNDDQQVAGTSGSKRNKFLEGLEDISREEDNNKDEDGKYEEGAETQKSTMEQRDERLKRKIQALEDAAVGEKQWQLKGEITAEDRPQNSLLEEIVEFDLSTRPAPVMTEQTTLQLEDIIRQRIKDKAFDSVERKEKRTEAPLEFKKKLVLDQEKSKQSLAQIYENEYLASRQDPDAVDKEEEEPQLHLDIKKMMHTLFSQLDALSNFHFTPKPAQVEMKVISNLPALNLEEVAPVTTSDAAMLAPEEVKAKIRGDIIGKTERTATDKRRERRKKKTKQHQHALIQTKKAAQGKLSNEGTAKQVAKAANVDKIEGKNAPKSVTSSSAFFAQLEDQVKTQIKSKTAAKKVPKNKNIDAKKLKL